MRPCTRKVETAKDTIAKTRQDISEEETRRKMEWHDDEC